tara:strand:+ start:397 stop:576 length:180 start_codon:yes stop_codon:yes gene_type:complete
MSQSSNKKRLNMKKKLEKNIAEIIIVILLMVIFSSCGTTQYNVGTGEKMKKHCSGAWIR